MSARVVKGFDAEAIQAGNFAHRIDHEKAARESDALLSRMTLAQKVNEIRGLQPQPIDGLYHAGGDPALGLAPWKMVDGPRGARAGHATAFPVAIARAASFDVELERRVGAAIGLEVAAKGGNVLLAPTINLLRHPGWGRAQETYSEDTHHRGAMAVAFVAGVQQHVLASPKHYALNNLENTRFQLTADVDPRSLREVYLPHFRRCVVEARAGSLMTAYNQVNGTWCSEHVELLDGILRREWGFLAFGESDWCLGTRSTAPAMRAGLDIEMPAGFRRSDEHLEAGLASGELDEDAIHRAARRSVYQKVAWQVSELGLAGRPRPDPAVVECAEHVALAREAAEKSLVLLKNAGAVLPLSREAGRRIAVVGDLAAEINLGDRGSSMVTPSQATSALDGLRAAAGAATLEHFASDADFAALGGFDVTLVVAGLTYRDEGEFIPVAQKEAEGTALARGGDRADLSLPARERELVARASAASRRTVVVLQGGSAVIVRDWIDAVDGLLLAWYGGRELGHALARVIFGDVSPSGRLPVSVPRRMEDLPPWDVGALRVPHDLLHGYRWLDHHGHAAEFPFGFGLGYTRFALSGLRLSRAAQGFTCRVDVLNEGDRAGATVVQLYVSVRDSAVPRVAKELKGFARVELEPGEVATVEIDVADEDLRYYDADARVWRLEDARYVFRAGESSGELPLAAEARRAGGRWLAS